MTSPEVVAVESTMQNKSGRMKKTQDQGIKHKTDADNKPVITRLLYGMNAL
jgi:hypothetical protein